ncbi:PKD domain-containing protein [Cellulomonas persica]|uniref:PKD domain-containing protein n=1 Tax=Cellulomonas persica TaxID=76861 RepID=A0A510UWI1_9CELL|nr:PKD domain-containing protein [Cellulomonas persica]GEK19052.1 hypothetical protein CPE01_27850 [Cellulomonas persica]
MKHPSLPGVSARRPSALLSATALAALVAAGLALPAQSATAAEVSLPDATVEPTVRQEWRTVGADTFTRTSSAGWGTAETGGAWEHTGTATQFTATGGKGLLTVTRAGSTITSALPGATSTDTVLTATTTAQSAQTGSGTHLSYLARRVGSAHYGAKVRLQTTGVTTLALVESGTSLTTTTLPGTFGAGDAISVKVEVVGTSPTTLRAKAWAAGTAEPSDWMLTTTSSTAALQQAGDVAVNSYLSGSVTNVPQTFAYDDITVSQLVDVPNTLPTAAFTSETADLAAQFDAADSQDTDGEIEQYTWAFGDGTVTTGPTAEHTYTDAGTYAATLAVTDNDGDTSVTTKDVVVTKPAPVTLAADDFSVARTGGWGTADQGGTWTHAGSASSYSVASKTGRQVVTAGGSTRTSELASVASTETDLTTTVSVDKPATGSGAYVTVIGRKVGSSSYSARLRLLEGGAAQLGVAANSSTLKYVTYPGYTTGDKVRIRVQVSGTAPTTLRAKAWKLGTAEPTDWMVVATDSTAALQAKGGIGVSTYLGSNATNAPFTSSWSDLRATTTDDRTVTPDPSDPGTDETTETGKEQPGATNTGARTGKFSTVHEGNLTVTQDGTVIDGWDIRGYVLIKAKNVVIRNSYIRGTVPAQRNDMVRVQNDAYSVTIEDTTIRASELSPNVDGVKGWNFTLRRVDISGVVDPVHIHGDNVTVVDSWLHDNSHYDNDPNWSGGPSHDDSIQIQGGANITIHHNTIEDSYSAALMITQATAPVTGITVTDNWIDNGGCSINLADNRGALPGATITGNVFGRGQIHKNCAIRVPSAWTLDVTGNEWTDGTEVKRTNF